MYSNLGSRAEHVLRAYDWVRRWQKHRPLFARRKARREWVVLDAISFKLLAFHDEESASNPKKDPLYTVPLINAAFRVEPESPSTFSIFGRKYTYQAENRNAMLAWLSCLQACRDSEGSEIKHVNYDGNEKSERWSSNLSLNHRFSDFDYWSLVNFQEKLLSDRAFISLNVNRRDECCAVGWQSDTKLYGVLKARFSPHEATDTTSPSLVASPVMDDTHFFPHIGSDSGSLSEMDEVNNFMKVEFQQTLEKIERLRKVNEEMESELHDLRIGYASLLQSCYKYKLGGALESDRYADLPISDKHKIRVGHLLEIARREDPRLPSASLISSRGGHMNTYGFQESFEKEESTMLYLASLLLDTYKLNSPPEELKIAQWNEILNSNFSLVPRQRLKELCRSGIPGGIRPEVWKELVKLGAKLFQLNMDPQHYQNLTDRVKDVLIRCNVNGQFALVSTMCSHQHSLCGEAIATVNWNDCSNRSVDSSCRRQITLDVLRTFPNHVAFNRPEGFGVQKMQEVLQAFTIHNQEVGYCQGMNFIVGNASLFLDKETTFWLLVLIVERYFPQKYFNEGLIAAQADQIVLRDLIAKYCPRIAKAMQELEVDISTITLNWFIAVYVSTVPIEVSTFSVK
ncbi:TBC1 domain-containing protein [Echinococcus granulosus]|uniref:TBC1 domain-containing protein n=1 Tax=Echinococcus granulosus TaxID=6210 RepID=W6U413_ECHGR|nr:TBC1 domain-containing protein [Echinococcus granulosus]EUB55848.1 TBC1 domain-containing protein [Echinococcus granulosus]